MSAFGVKADILSGTWRSVSLAAREFLRGRDQARSIDERGTNSMGVVHQGNGVGSELFDSINELLSWPYAQNK